MTMVPRQIYSVGSIPYGFNICIYGSGGAGRRLLEEIITRRSDLSVALFLDSESDGPSDAGVPQLSFENYLKRNLQHDLIVVASAFSDEIVDTLEHFGLRNYTSYTADTYNDQAMAQVDISLMCRTGKMEKIELFREIEPGRKVLCFDLTSDSTRVYTFTGSVKMGYPPTQGLMLYDFSSVPCRQELLYIVRSAIDLSNANCVLFHVSSGRIDSCLKIYDRIATWGNVAFKLLCDSSRRQWNGLMLPDGRVGYVSIPKCGTSTMTAALSEVYLNDYEESECQRHRSSSLLKFRNYPFKPADTSCNVLFTLVRNPYERLASFFHSYLTRGDFQWLHYLGNRYGEHPLSFSSLCDYICHCSDSLLDIHLKPQHTFLMNETSTFFVQHLFQIETFDHSLKSMNALLPKPIKSYHLNQSDKKQSYMNMYYRDPELKEAVYRRYERDFSLLGYDS